MIGLTPRERDLLEVIKNYMAARQGCAPSFAEMQERMGMASKAGIHRLLTALEERGAIKRLYNRKRAIEVIEVEATPAISDLEIMPLDQLRRHIALASGILAHRQGGGRLTPSSTVSAPDLAGGR